MNYEYLYITDYVNVSFYNGTSWDKNCPLLQKSTTPAFSLRTSRPSHVCEEDQMLVMSHCSRIVCYVYLFLNHRKLHVTNSEEAEAHATYSTCRFKL